MNKGAFNENSFRLKIKKWGTRAGKNLMTPVLAMFYCMKDKNTPVRAKVVIAGALAYFVLPTDLIFDLSPVLGFTDDLTVILTAYETIRRYITPEHSRKAREQLNNPLKA